MQTMKCVNIMNVHDDCQTLCGIQTIYPSSHDDDMHIKFLKIKYGLKSFDIYIIYK